MGEASGHYEEGKLTSVFFSMHFDMQAFCLCFFKEHPCSSQEILSDVKCNYFKNNNKLNVACGEEVE